MEHLERLQPLSTLAHAEDLAAAAIPDYLARLAGALQTRATVLASPAQQQPETALPCVVESAILLAIAMHDLLPVHITALSQAIEGDMQSSQMRQAVREVRENLYKLGGILMQHRKALDAQTPQR